MNTFAFSLFCLALYYIANAGETAEIFNPFPGRVVVVYITAFVDIAIASSIVMNINVAKICYWGGIYWAIVSTISFLAGIIGNPHDADLYVTSFIISIGFTAAIFYIASEAD